MSELSKSLFLNDLSILPSHFPPILKNEISYSIPKRSEGSQSLPDFNIGSATTATISIPDISKWDLMSSLG